MATQGPIDGVRSIVLVSLAACTPATVAIPASLTTGGDRFAVDGPGVLGTGDVTFGPYRALDVHHGWVDSSTSKSWGWGTPVETESSQEYSFRAVAADGAAYPVACRSASFESTTGAGRVTATSSTVRVGCTISGPSQGELVIDLDGGGKITVGGASFEIAALRDFEGTSVRSSSALGYAVRANGAALGAVQLVNARAVWIARGLAKEQALAVAIATSALLLFQDPRQHKA